MKNGNDNKKIFNFAPTEKDNVINEKRILKFEIDKNHLRYFKALLVLRDLTINDFFGVFFKLVMDEDERVLSIIKETEQVKKNKLISRLSNPDKDDLYELIEQDSPLSTGRDTTEDSEDDIIEQDWKNKRGIDRKRYGVENSSRDEKF